MKRIVVTCDGCHKRATIRFDQAAPKGWFFIPIDRRRVTGPAALACSEACCKRAWRTE